MRTVSLITGKSRRDNIRTSLSLISDDIKDHLNSKQVIIKPNFVSTSVQLAASHVDQMRGILDFFSELYKKKVLIAEAALGDTKEGFKNFGYNKLLREYNIELIDLNEGPFTEIALADRDGKTVYVRASNLLLNKNNYIISAAKLKTHDTVVVTLSIKNAAMGSIYRSDKILVHQGLKQINNNITALAQLSWPDLSVIDGFTGMEGNGPIHGSPIDIGVAIASTDPLAADSVACRIMGVDIFHVGYLTYCYEKGMGEAEFQNIKIIGRNLSECIKPFKLHRSVDEQLGWKNESRNEMV